MDRAAESLDASMMNGLEPKAATNSDLKSRAIMNSVSHWRPASAWRGRSVRNAFTVAAIANGSVAQQTRNE